MRALSTRLVPALAALVPVAVLAACGPEPVDLSKVTFERTTVPAGEGTSNSIDPNAVDNLNADGLRLVDPCALFDEERLGEYGTPAQSVAQDFHRCRHYMRDADEESLSFSIRVGETLTSSELDAKEKIGPFTADESTVEGACFVTLVLDQLDPPLGIELQTGYKADDPCPIGRKVATTMAERLVSPDSLRTPEPGSLMDLDPCAFVEDLPGQAVDGATDATPYGLHQCEWRNDDGVAVELQFGANRYDPGVREEERRGDEIDLGAGVKAYQLAAENIFPTCELSWLHLPTADEQGEVITVDVRDVRTTGLDACAAAVEFGKSLVPTLPKP